MSNLLFKKDFWRVITTRRNNRAAAAYGGSTRVSPFSNQDTIQQLCEEKKDKPEQDVLDEQHPIASPHSAFPTKKPPFRRWTWTMLALGCGSVGWIYWIGQPDKTSEASGENGFLGNIKRAYSKYQALVSSYNEPVFEKLLPDMYKGPDAKPYTLVIDLDRFLICHIWDPNLGRWKIAKRPGVDMFLFYMAHLYEVVVFSSLNQWEADLIMEKLDPLQFITFRLFKFATKYENGKYIKDISKLNRELSKVVVLGHDPSFASHSDNFIQLVPWEGNPKDSFLLDSIDFLEALAFSNAPDVRPIISSYKGLDLIQSYDQKQKLTYELLRESRNRIEQSRLKKFLYSIFAPKEELSEQQSSQTAPNELFLPYGQRKAQLLAQRKAEYEKGRASIQKEFDHQMKINKEYMSTHKMSLSDLFLKGPPAPPPELLSAHSIKAQEAD